METTEPDLVLKSAAVSLAGEVALVKIARIRSRTVSRVIEQAY
jgi:hypothetical protein